MSSDVAKFTITKDVDNTFVFTIKADGSTLPMVIDPADSFTARLVKLEDDTEALEKVLSHQDRANGKVSLVITAAEAANLEKDRGSKADRYYLKPVYKLVIECNTAVNGAFIAKVPEVYVD
jgi:hypothetical protein